MGLSPISYYLGWIITNLIHTFFLVQVQLQLELIAICFSFFGDIRFGDVVSYYLEQIFFSFAMIGYMLFFSSFLSDRKKAMQFYIFYNIVAMILIFCFKDNQITIFLFPQMLLLRQHMIWFIIQGFVGMSLFVVIEYIQLSQIYNHPFQVILKMIKRKNQVEMTLEDQELQQQQIIMAEDLLNESEFVQQVQINEQAQIRISNLTKVYNETSVVDNLNLTCYKNQIFCLLGHNGAGKSTTLNMICGAVIKNNGKIFINNFDIDSRLSDIRQILGYFSQNDVIYQDLTVNQHLIFYGKIKQLNNPIILQQSINNLLELCELQQQQNQLGKYLSNSGKRRKLSLAISLIGNSEIILLDEPTTGLDPMSKQQIWNILKRIKQNKCIIMTTHFMDEAQELSDRIGIIQKGKLIVCGTVDFIKKQFSVGYNITIQFQNQEQSFNMNEQIKQQINNICKEEVQYLNENNIIKINVPQRFGKQIGIILKYLATIKVIQTSLEMTSLEDAYIKIHQELNQHQQIQEEIEYEEIFDGTKPDYNQSKQIQGLFLRRCYSFKKNGWQLLLLCLQQVPLIIYASKKLETDSFLFSFYVITKSFFVIQHAYQPIQEKQQKIKFYLIKHGMRPINYWIAYLKYDLIYEFVSYIVLIFTEYIFEFLVQAFLDKEYSIQNTIYFIIFLFLFSINLICQAYAISSVFQSTFTSILFLPLFFIIQIPCLQLFQDIEKHISELGFIIKLFLPIVNLGSLIQSLEKGDSKLIFSLTTLISSILYFSLTIIIDNYINPQPVECHVDNIQVKEINQQFKNKQIMKNVSFTCQSQQILGLIGYNGSGKTAILNILAREYKPQSGNVHIYNELNDLGYVPNYFPLWENLTPEQHLMIYGYIKGLDKDKIKYFIEKYSKIMDLERKRNKKIQNLSIGEKRKLLIGIALIGGSSKLLMNQPTSGIDPVYRKEFFKIIRKSCQDNGNSVILTTNSLQEADQICDVIGIMIDGKLKFCGTITEFKSQFQNLIKIIFQAKNNEKLEQLTNIIKEYLSGFKIQFVEQINQNQISFIFSIEILTLSRIFQFCSSKLISQHITQFEIQKPSFDHVMKKYLQQFEPA